MVRINLKVAKILNILKEKDHLIFDYQINDKLLDTMMLMMLLNCSKCLKSSQNLLKLAKSFTSKGFYEPEFAYYHLERAVE